MSQNQNDTATYHRKLLEAHLSAAWMRRCGPSGTPGEWFIPGEVLEVMDGVVEVEAYPSYALVDVGGKVTGWSPHLRNNPARAEAWEWRFGAGWADFDETEVDAIEDLGGCFDDYHVNFVVLGSHQEPPPITDELAQAFALSQEGA